MKTSFILFGLFLSSFVWGQAYQYAPFPQQYGLWHYTYFDGYGNQRGFVESIYQRDSTRGIMASPSDGYYEDNKRVYRFTTSDTTLMYDFNLTLGDTILADVGLGLDTFYVVADDSAGFHGRRQISLFTNSWKYGSIEWVEGIGNVGGSGAFGTLWDNFSLISVSGRHIFWCTYADSATFPCNSDLSQRALAHNAEVEVYPNPNPGTFKLKSGLLQEHSIRVYNSYGQCVFSALGPSGGEALEIHLPNAEPGLYILELRNAKTVRTQKVLVH